jgi:hypothetical protein
MPDPNSTTDQFLGGRSGEDNGTIFMLVYLRQNWIRAINIQKKDAFLRIHVALDHVLG